MGKKSCAEMAHVSLLFLFYTNRTMHSTVDKLEGEIYVTIQKLNTLRLYVIIK